MPGMQDAPRLYRVLRRSVPPLADRWFPLTVEGVENVPDSQPAILACNHLSFVDSVVLPLHIRRPVYFLGKADYWDSWRTRWFVRATGVVPVHRDGGERGAGSLRTGVELLARGELLGIYPEGTRSPDGRLYRGKTGPVRIALEAGVPIIPCAVLGSREALPPGRRVPRRRPITVRYGQPLDLSRYRDRRDEPFALRSATDELMYEIMRLSGQEYVDEYAAAVRSGGHATSAERRVDGVEDVPSGDDRTSGGDTGRRRAS